MNEEKATDIKAEEEAEANYFAMCLLIPESFIRRELGDNPALDFADDNQIMELASRYEVSVSLMSTRLLQIYKHCLLT